MISLIPHYYLSLLHCHLQPLSRRRSISSCSSPPPDNRRLAVVSPQFSQETNKSFNAIFHFSNNFSTIKLERMSPKKVCDATMWSPLLQQRRRDRRHPRTRVALSPVVCNQGRVLVVVVISEGCIYYVCYVNHTNQ